MPRFRPRNLLLSLVFGGCVLGAQAQEEDYAVDIDGPSDAVNLLERHLDLYKWRSRGIEADELRAVIERTPADAEALLNTAGYFKPKVEARLEGEAGHYRVRVTVDPGKLALVRNVALSLEGPINEDTEYRDRMLAFLERNPPLSKDVPFSQSAWSAYKRRALTALQFQRYPAARITRSEARIDPATASADLTLVLDSGPFYRYGEVRIDGLSRYPERIVRDQVHLEPGAEFNRRDLQKLQADLQDMPNFSTVIVEPALSADPPYEAPIHVTVQEAPLQKMTLGAGYSTNTGFRGEVTHRYNNVAGRGWILDSDIRLEQLEQAIEVGLTFPKHASGYSHRIYASGERSTSNNLDSDTYKAGISRAAKGDRIDRTITLEYLAERRELDDGTVENPQTLALSYQWIRRDLDSLRNPRKGSVLQLEAGGGVRGVLSDETFLRLYGRTTYYWPVADADVLIGRLEIGNTSTKDPSRVPTDFLFRAGGSNSVRGYDYESLGVRDGDTVKGGRVLATATLEYQHAVYKDWRAAVFVDHGDAANNWGDYSGKTGVGVGARWVSPVGVLGADVAYGIDDEQIKLYFALGVAF
ncbi:outer membrane protein assembly factor [Chitiniphilus shinanonensis]|uniref:Outer membrane protein assembly factor n=1 Tax=Chitiniphilus shinanonensis TaxID=553088 RepID=A0ABQ6BW05_9NEIS|nr:autotransporter assembly complex family protein [Chitiniphilus shinanonensis]GLS05567.1 outer membrane protein assembly factor [Chitiniphilus shinanonensis]